MTPREIRDRINEIAKSIGERASIYVGFSGIELPLYATIHAGGETRLRVRAENWEDMFTNIQDEWDAYDSEYRASMTQKMALQIIKITDEQGECTDAALRGSWTFTDADVRQFGPDACAKADEMAGRGPFSITTIAGANAA